MRRKRPFREVDDEKMEETGARAKIWATGGRLRFSRVLVVLGVLLTMLVIYAIVQPGMLSSSGIMTLADEYTALALAAVGETFVVLTGGIDLSVGALISAVNVFLVVYMQHRGNAPWFVVLVAVTLSVFAGVINGLFVAYLDMPPIIVTLATMFVWTGIALLILPQPGGSVPLWFVNGLTGRFAHVVPVSVIILVGVILLCWYISHTRLGTAIYAIGGNEEAARISGISVTTTKMAAFALSGLFYGLAGVFLTAQSGSGDPTIGSSFLLETFAAVVVGGTAIGGGRGGLSWSIAGAFILGIITNLLFQFGVSSFSTPAFYGATLVLAALLSSDSLRQRLLTAWRWRQGRTALRS